MVRENTCTVGHLDAKNYDLGFGLFEVGAEPLGSI
jgi:hypothetical protein